jgi:trk system potassium uptake protein TrkH
MISLFIVIAGIMLIQMTELGHLPHTMSRGKFLELSFEILSAFGTAGLSMGVTNSLSDPGKIIIILLMFIGRLGPLVIAIAVSRRQKAVRYRYAEEDIMIG